MTTSATHVRAAPPRRLPWYSFLYRLLGAHGTFWLWVLAIIAVWWTARPALVRMFNRTPHRASVVQAAAPEGLVRWVEVEGVGLELDRSLLLRKGSSHLAPVLLLLEPGDPAARWWAETRALADVATGIPVPPALGGMTGVVGSPAARQAARRAFIRRFAELEGHPERYLPAPDRALPVQPERRGPPAPRTAPATDGDRIADFLARIERHLALVRERVRPGLAVKGLLTPTPVVYKERVQEELDVVAAPFLLQAGREPSEAESVVFGAALISLILLAFGLRGAARVPAPPDEGSP